MQEWYIGENGGNEVELGSPQPWTINDAWRREQKVEEWTPPYYLSFFVEGKVTDGWSFEDVSGSLRPTAISAVEDEDETYVTLTISDLEVTGEIHIKNSHYSNYLVFRSVQ